MVPVTIRPPHAQTVSITLPTVRMITEVSKSVAVLTNSAIVKIFKSKVSFLDTLEVCFSYKIQRQCSLCYISLPVTVHFVCLQNLLVILKSFLQKITDRFKCMFISGLFQHFSTLALVLRTSSFINFIMLLLFNSFQVRN